MGSKMYNIEVTEVREICKVFVVDNSLLKTIHACFLQLVATSQSRFLQINRCMLFAADADQVHSTGTLPSLQDMTHSQECTLNVFSHFRSHPRTHHSHHAHHYHPGNSLDSIHNPDIHPRSRNTHPRSPFSAHHSKAHTPVRSSPP